MLEANPMKPRSHAFQMKYLLARFALESPAEFFDKFGPNEDVHVFSRLWTACGEEFDPAERVSNRGTSMWRSSATADSCETVVLTFPAPEAMGEAYFLGAVRISQLRCRVFCLERSIVPPKHEDVTVLSELAPDGRMNWGSGPSPTVPDFVSRVRGIISDATAAPLSFVPIKLV
jgi:hypothetical protein